MDWGRATVDEVDGQIERLRIDLGVQVARECDAIAARERAMGQVDAANADIQRCRDAKAADRAEIDMLLEERQKLIPGQRER